MNALIDEDTLNTINGENLSTYLGQTGWQEMSHPDQRLRAFIHRSSDSEPILLVVPIDRNMSDYTTTMQQALTILSQVERLPVNTLLQKLRGLNEDIMHMRLLLAEGHNPSIDLTAQFIQGWRNLIQFAARLETSTEKEKRSYFPSTTDAGKQELQLFAFCHTQPGSFTFALSSPLSSLGERLFPDVDPPVTRKIVERITRGLQSTQVATTEGKSNLISDIYTRGLNGNMCFAAEQMLENLQDTTLEYTVTWSTALHAPADLDHLIPIKLDRASLVYLRQAGDHLKATAEKDAKVIGMVEIHGTIVELFGDEDKQSGLRSILIDPLHYSQRIKAALTEQDYKQACNAHRDQRPISIRGQLIQKRAPWILTNAQGLLMR